MKKMNNVRKVIVEEFSKWAVLSSFRRGPIRSREKVYELLSRLEYATLMDGPEINETEFMSWHRKNIQLIQEKCKEKFGKELPIGWGVKMINMYLKTKVYIAQEKVRSGLVKMIHPPIDSYLWKGIENRYQNDFEIISRTHVVRKIQDIDDYDAKYIKLIEGFKMIAKKENCLLIEVEQFWQPTG